MNEIDCLKTLKSHYVCHNLVHYPYLPLQVFNPISDHTKVFVVIQTPCTQSVLEQPPYLHHFDSCTDSLVIQGCKSGLEKKSETLQ